MCPEDPAFAPGRNSVKREMAKRLWAVLVYQDVRSSLESSSLRVCINHSRNVVAWSEFSKSILPHFAPALSVYLALIHALLLADILFLAIRSRHR